jgi:hypothetical protein
MTGQDFGLSKKTNEVIAGLASITMCKDFFRAIVVIAIIVLVGLTYQFVLDWRKNET